MVWFSDQLSPYRKDQNDLSSRGRLRARRLLVQGGVHIYVPFEAWRFVAELDLQDISTSGFAAVLPLGESGSDRVAGRDDLSGEDHVSPFLVVDDEFDFVASATNLGTSSTLEKETRKFFGRCVLRRIGSSNSEKIFGFELIDGHKELESCFIELLRSTGGVET